MNTASIMDIAWEGAQLAFRAIMAARTRQDAEALRDQLRALGPAQRSDVAGIEARARERLAPDFPGETCPDCSYVGDLSVECPECSPHRAGGPLDTSPTETSTGRLYRTPLAPDFPGGRAAAEREYMAIRERVGDADTGGVLVGGPLDGGD